jgi:hypothetical protein
MAYCINWIILTRKKDVSLRSSYKKIVNGVIRLLHSSPFGGGGKTEAVKTLNKLRQYGVFVYMYYQVEEAVKKYELCLRRDKISVSYPTLKDNIR